MIKPLRLLSARLFGSLVAASRPADAHVIVGSIAFAVGEAFRRWDKDQDELLDMVQTMSDGLLDGYGVERPKIPSWRSHVKN